MSDEDQKHVENVNVDNMFAEKSPLNSDGLVGVDPYFQALSGTSEPPETEAEGDDSEESESEPEPFLPPLPN